MVAAAIAAALVPTGARADDWSSYQHDPQSTGRSTSLLDPATLQTSWSAPDGYHGPLIAGNGVLAFNATSASLASFNVANGQVNWMVRAPRITTSAIAYGGGLVLYPTTSAGSPSVTSLVVVDAASGATKYTFPLPQQGTLPDTRMATDAATGRQVVYVNDGRGVMSAFRLDATAATPL